MATNPKEALREFNHVDLLHPSKYLKAGELRGKHVAVTIDSITPREELTMEGNRKDYKPVVYFKGKEKGLVLNKTNARSIAKVYGAEVTGWIGKTIVLYPTQVKAKGEIVDAIRVDVEKTKARQANSDEPVEAA